MNSLLKSVVLLSTLLGTGASAIVFANPVQAAEWVKVTENAAKDSFFIDSSTIKKTGNIVTYWEYREFVEPTTPSSKTSLNKTNRSTAW